MKEKMFARASRLRCVSFACLCFMGQTSSQDIDLKDEKFDDIGQKFLSYLSEEVKEKLIIDGKMMDDFYNLNHTNLNEFEKKEIEAALQKAFEPLLAEFVEMLSEKDQLTEVISQENIESKKVDQNNEIDEKNKQEL